MRLSGAPLVPALGWPGWNRQNHRARGAITAVSATAIGVGGMTGARLLGYSIKTGPAGTWITLVTVLVGSFVVEYVYRRRSGRRLTLDTPES